MEQTKISIIIPTYNEENNIQRTLNSVLKATNIEIISPFALGLEIEVITIDFEPYCSDIFETLKQVKEFKTCDYSHTPQFNNRVEQVCVFSDSVAKLTQRGYLI